jgi:hypothetical protein
LDLDLVENFHILRAQDPGQKLCLTPGVKNGIIFTQSGLKKTGASGKLRAKREKLRDSRVLKTQYGRRSIVMPNVQTVFIPVGRKVSVHASNICDGMRIAFQQNFDRGQSTA